MCEPVPNSPQDVVVTKQYITNNKLFNKTAKFWVEKKANREKNFTIKLKK